MFLGKTKFGAQKIYGGLTPNTHRGYKSDSDFPDTSLN